MAGLEKKGLGMNQHPIMIAIASRVRQINIMSRQMLVRLLVRGTVARTIGIEVRIERAFEMAGSGVIDDPV